MIGVLICNDENLFFCTFDADRWIDRCHSMLDPVPIRVRAYQMIKHISYLQKVIRNQRCIKQTDECYHSESCAKIDKQIKARQEREANVHEDTEKAVKN